MNRTLLFTLFFVLTSLFSYSQLPPYNPGGGGHTPIGPQLPPITPQQGAQMAKYQKGNGAFEEWFMEIFVNMEKDVEIMAFQGGRLGLAIGVLGGLIYFSVIGFRMLSGSAEWDVEPMIKPTIILIILSNWYPFTQMIEYPFDKLSEMPAGYFKELERDAEAKRELRYTKQMQVLDATIKFRSQVQSQVDRMTLPNAGTVQLGAEVFDFFYTAAADNLERLNYWGQKLLGELLELICLMILRVGVYLTFFIQKIWTYILIVLGPIAVGMSLFPGFDSSFNNWIAKFININLYTFIAYTIINLGQKIIMAGYEMDIKRLSAIVDSQGNVINYGLLMNYTTYSGMLNSVVFPCVGYVVTGIAVLMTPSIADTIVSAGGAGVMTKAHKDAAKMASVSAKAVSAPVSAAKSATNAVKSSVAQTTLSAVTGGLNNMPYTPMK
ncbi:type IV secretion system protein [Capnocytophaga leadbetteri]|uniref:type IV secretion system protein n=1 Tax=Capnocytophaga leadbetteri TaxID=327575 RepID=UPI0028E78D06|nr:type IV secretion system protein [Capnocytophaga leadbetteri]